ncbi:MAG: glutamate--tRNA ligase, partial [Candidatus Bathyarchaeia archaeon]
MPELKEQAELRELILKFALINAIKHEGKALKGPVIGKVLAEKPELRARAKEITKMIEEVVEEVNNLPQ